MPKAAALKQKNKPHKGVSKGIIKKKKSKAKAPSKTIRKRVKQAPAAKRHQLRVKARS
jgi:hypothetical protein